MKNKRSWGRNIN